MSGARPSGKTSPADNPSAGPVPKRATLPFELVLLGIAAVSVLLRIWMSVQVVATDPFAFDPPDVTDMATYHALSRGILNGIFPAEFVYQPFYYSVFLL